MLPNRKVCRVFPSLIFIIFFIIFLSESTAKSEEQAHEIHDARIKLRQILGAPKFLKARSRARETREKRQRPGSRTENFGIKFSEKLPGEISTRLGITASSPAIVENAVLAEEGVKNPRSFSDLISGGYSVRGISEKRLRKLQKLGIVEMYSRAKIMKTSSEVGDEFFNDFQIGFENTGQGGATPDIDINASNMWNVRTDSSQVVVAIVDTGLDVNHPDLQGNIWVNPGEIPGNGIDDDGNGFIDDINGVDGRADIPAASRGIITDGNGHGTHVAGTIGARGNNGRGVAGVAWNAKIMGIKVLDDSGSGFIFDVAEGINYARKLRLAWLDSNPNNGGADVRVINYSLGATGDCSALDLGYILLQGRIQQANDIGITVVVAAGNDATNTDITPQIPASCDSPNMVIVANSDNTGFLQCSVARNAQGVCPKGNNRGSNYGLTTVDLAAPGVKVLSTVPSTFANPDKRDLGGTGARYEFFTGTSMSTPHVVGVISLMLAQNPALSPTVIRDLLIASDRERGSLNGYLASPGILNGFAAVNAAASAPSSWKNPVNAHDVDANGTVNGQDLLTIYDRLSPAFAALPVQNTNVPPPFTDINGSKQIDMNDVDGMKTRLISIGMVTDISQNVAAGQVLNYTTAANAAALSMPSGATFIRSNGRLTYNTIAAQAGTTQSAVIVTPDKIIRLTINITSSSTAPQFTVHPQNASRHENQSVIFNCSANGSPAPTYRWQRNSADLSPAVTTQSLTVVATAALKGSTYRCVASNTAGTTNSNGAVLNIIYAADFNSDGKVDALDKNIWQQYYGLASGALKSQGDADGNGSINGRDFLIWQRQFGLN